LVIVVLCSYLAEVTALQARREAEEFYAEQERIARRTWELRTELETELTPDLLRAGKFTPEALDTARGQVQAAINAGFDRAAAKEAVVAAVTPEGKMKVTGETLQKLIAGVQLGHFDLKAPEERAAKQRAIVHGFEKP